MPSIAISWAFLRPVSVKNYSLFLFSEGKVAGVSQARDNVRVAGELFVYGSHPEGHSVARKMLLDVFHCICAADRADKMRVLWLSFFT